MSDLTRLGKLLNPLTKTVEKKCLICDRPVLMAKGIAKIAVCAKHDHVLKEAIEADGI